MTKNPLKRNAKLPSNDLEKKGCLPNRLPMRAAVKSEMMSTLKHEIVMILGNTRTQSVAEISTYDAPFNRFSEPSVSCFLRRNPKVLRKKSLYGFE